MVRVGISLYGHWPSKETHLSWLLAHGRDGVKLEPALAWRARVGQVKRVAAGAPIGYGLTYRPTRPSTIAVLPVGYADGYPRALSNRARVLLRGRPAPVVGRVCMDILMADVTDIPGVGEGDVATLIGADGGERVSAEELAELAGTINYEILARLSPALARSRRRVGIIRPCGPMPCVDCCKRSPAESCRPSDAAERFAGLPFALGEGVMADTHRALRTGESEAVYCSGKTPEQAAAAFAALARGRRPGAGDEGDAGARARDRRGGRARSAPPARADGRAAGRRAGGRLGRRRVRRDVRPAGSRGGRRDGRGSRRDGDARARRRGCGSSPPPRPCPGACARRVW